MNAPEYFAKATREELELVLQLPPRQLRVWFGVRLLGRNGWAIKRRDLEAVTRMGERQVQLALAELERGGYLNRSYCGQRKDPWGRFRAVVGVPGQTTSGRQAGTPIWGIGVDRSGGSVSAGEHRSGRSVYTSQGSDLGDPVLLGDLGSDPSLPPEGSGEGGRVLEELERTARELFPNVATGPLRRYVAQLRALAGDVEASELVAYLRWAAQDETLARARMPLAAAATRDRLAPWLRRRRAARATNAPRARASGPALAAPEAVELAEQALRSLK